MKEHQEAYKRYTETWTAAGKVFADITASARRIYLEETAHIPMPPRGDGTAWKEYENAVEPALSVYREAIAIPLRDYARAVQPAWDAYDEACRKEDVDRSYWLREALGLHG